MQKYLQVARKHILSVICAVVALAAVVLAFYPTGSWFADLQSKLDERVKVNASIATLLRPNRHTLPVVGEGSTTPSQLTVFPSEDVYQKGKAAVRLVHDESTDKLQEATQINQHILLDKDALPNGDDIARATFRQLYLAALADDARIRAWPDAAAARSRHIPALMPGRHLSQIEIDKSLADLRAEVDKQNLVKSVVDGQITPESTEQANQVYLTKSTTRPLQLEMDAARKCKVYLEPGAIKKPEVYALFVSADKSLNISDVWAAQLARWIDEDVATGVAYANENAADVTESPVKQIVDVSFKNPMYVAKDDPKAGKDDATLNKAFDVSPTGRESNGMYDVVQYNITLDVDAGHVPSVLDALEKDQFISILSVNMTAVDTSDAALGRFMYGNHPIARIVLTCEELFMHDWLKDVQPPNTGPVAGQGVAFGGASGGPSGGVDNGAGGRFGEGGGPGPGSGGRRRFNRN